MSGEVRIGLLGLGRHGQRYARHLLAGDAPGVRLTVVCRSDAARGREFASRHRVDFEPRWQALVCRSDVDALAIAAAPAVSTEAAIGALEAGRPVLLEKPVAESREAGRALAAAAAGAGAPPLMVAHTLRWNATIRALAARVPDLGPLRLLAVAQRLEFQERGDWLDRDPGGDVLLNTGVHGFDLVRHLAGREVERVWCRSELVQTRRQADTFIAGLRLAGGLLATVDNCRATATRSGRIEVVGEHGTLVADQVRGTLALQEGRQERALAVPPAGPTVAAALADFGGVVRDGAPVPVSLGDGLAAVAVALACRHASKAGAEVAVEPF